MTTAPGTLYLDRIDSPIGRIEITSDGTSVTSVSMEHDGTLPHDGIDDASAPVLADAARQLRQYFAGERSGFDVPVAPRGTAFQMAVWEQIAAIGWGETRSYGEIGRAIERPHAGRAIGQAVGANPLPLLIGCHRVLSSTGHITGYSGGNGIPTKIWLLDHEKIAHRGAAPALFDLEPAGA